MAGYARCNAMVMLLGTDTVVTCEKGLGHMGAHHAAQAGGPDVEWTAHLDRDGNSETETTRIVETTTELIPAELTSIGIVGDATGIAHNDDILILSGNVTAGEADQLKAKLLERLPGIRDVVITPGLRLEAIYRPDPDDEDEAP